MSLPLNFLYIYFCSVHLFDTGLCCLIVFIMILAQCLYTVTEDNAELSSTGLKDTIKKSIATSGNTSELVLIRTLSMGVLVNLECSRLSTAQGDLVVPMVTTLAEVLGIDVLAVLLHSEVGSVGWMDG